MSLTRTTINGLRALVNSAGKLVGLQSEADSSAGYLLGDTTEQRLALATALAALGATPYVVATPNQTTLDATTPGIVVIGTPQDLNIGAATEFTPALHPDAPTLSFSAGVGTGPLLLVPPAASHGIAFSSATLSTGSAPAVGELFRLTFPVALPGSGVTGIAQLFDPLTGTVKVLDIARVSSTVVAFSLASAALTASHTYTLAVQLFPTP